MTTINKKSMTSVQSHGVPYGNVWQSPKFHFETGSTGIMVANGAADSDLATAVVNGTIVRLGILPAGLELQDMQRTISDAFASSTTDAIGFLYCDGVDVSTAAQDAAYFCAATASDATAVTRKTGVKAPLVLAKDAYLVLTVGGADHSAAGIEDIYIIGRHTGGF